MEKLKTEQRVRVMLTVSLQEKGKDEFRSFVSSVKKELKTDKAVSVWTSPMKRAKQTAEILTNIWNGLLPKKKSLSLKGTLKF